MFTLSSEDRKNYKSIILLNEMINRDTVFNIVMNGDDKLLESFFVQMLSDGLVSMIENRYQPTQKGINALELFMKRYAEYLKLYDVYAFVDLDAGEFAFARYFDFQTDAEWNAFKQQERFQDVRLAVATTKKLNPSEIVFMSFINECRFDTTTTGWQMDLLSEAVWNHIEEIVNTAITAEELGKDAMEDIIGQGTALAVNLIKRERELQIERQQYEQQQRQQQHQDNQNNQGAGEVETVVETIETEEYIDEYYYPYMYDPYYVSPFWLVPLFII